MSTKKEAKEPAARHEQGGILISLPARLIRDIPTVAAGANMKVAELFQSLRLRAEAAVNKELGSVTAQELAIEIIERRAMQAEEETKRKIALLKGEGV
jgi:EAL domain-containing protein (putative c-di-GMP-specific phosphodiesterase class I)